MSVGLSTSIQTSTITLEDTLTSPHETEWPPAEVVPVVTPPSLEEVQQAVHEASEKVEGGAAEQVLNELLERVVEAALGQVEEKQDELAVQEGAAEDAVGVEDETEVEVSEEMVVGIDAGAEEEQEAEEGVGETVADHMEEATVGEDTAGTDGVIDKSEDAEVSREVAEETVATSEELGKDVALDNQKAEDGNNQVVMLDGRVETETTSIVQEMDVGGEQDTGADSDLSVVVEQIGTVAGTDESLQEEAPLGEIEGEAITLASDNSDIEAKQSVVEEAAAREENYTVKDAQNQDAEQSHLEEEVADIEMVVEERESNGGESQQDIEQEYEMLVNGGDEQQTGVEAVTSQTSNDLKEDPERDDDAEASVERRPKKQGPAARGTALSEVAENVFTDHGNESPTPTDDLLARDPNMARPTRGYFVKDLLAIPPQARGELVEDTAGDPETKDIALEAWKTATTIAAVFLVFETVVIIIYFLKCLNTNSLATQRSCEEGCVEPEVTTGGDSSDDTLHAGNGDTQQYVKGTLRRGAAWANSSVT
ncbi:high mobility group nucleosome-binding domain-containing protein 5 [Phyllopteryx taeniolatus]|uniref:high mobility group nucleosome-binding domain-containing protein 5 n=1 Tax=Phyllopteryx taeniolatus TaxID=161469 RepID=UPI002AD29200|nr:high mobility group nucleosome-binding domain-containing protein 5 [Phyllopteryx taeniolatus]